MHLFRAFGNDMSIEVAHLPAAALLIGHTHPTTHILFQINGVLVDEGMPIDEGDIRISSSNDSHSIRANRQTVCVLLHLAPAIEIVDRRSIATDRPLVALVALAADVATALRLQADDLDCQARRLADRTLALCTRAGAQVAPKWLRDWKASLDVVHVETSHRNQPRSREHICRAFKRFYRTSPTAWVRHRRVAAAASLVVGSRHALADVAAICGFSDQSHMTREFRAALDATLGELRAAHAIRLDVTTVQDARPVEGER